MVGRSGCLTPSYFVPKPRTQVSKHSQCQNHFLWSHYFLVLLDKTCFSNQFTSLPHFCFKRGWYASRKTNRRLHFSKLHLCKTKNKNDFWAATLTAASTTETSFPSVTKVMIQEMSFISCILYIIQI